MGFCSLFAPCYKEETGCPFMSPLLSSLLEMESFQPVDYQFALTLLEIITRLCLTRVTQEIRDRS